MKALIAGILLCVASGVSAVSLAWDGDVQASGFTVYYSGASREYTNAVKVGKSQSVEIGSLTLGSRYFFAVAAAGTNGVESDFSTEISYVPTTNTNAVYRLTVEWVGTLTNGNWQTAQVILVTNLTGSAQGFYRLKIAKVP